MTRARQSYLLFPQKLGRRFTVLGLILTTDTGTNGDTRLRAS